MTQPPVEDRFEYWFEVIMLVVGMLLGVGMGVYGVISCTPYHPCPVWAQVMFGLGWAVTGMFGNALIIFWVVFVALNVARKLK